MTEEDVKWMREAESAKHIKQLLDAERYRFLRDNFATKSANSVYDFIKLEPMTGDYFDAHIDILMQEFRNV